MSVERSTERGGDGAWWAGLGSLVVAVGLVYAPTLRYGLVWDDWVNLGGSAGFRAPLGEAVRWAFTELRLGHYQPLAWLSFTLDHRLWGADLGGYHATNVLLHAANTVLFALVSRRLLARGRVESSPTGASTLGAWVAAGLFALHPMRVETVAWLTERRHLLAALFFLVAVLAWLRGLEPGGRRRRALAVCSGAYVLSLLATPLAAGLPVVLLVLDVVPAGRWQPGDGWRGLGRLTVEKTPLWVLALIFSGTALYAQREGEALLGLSSYSPLTRLSQVAYALLFYLRSLVAGAWYPLYERPAVLDPLATRFLASAVAVVALVALVVWKRKRWPAVTACAIAYVALLAPVSGLAQSGAQLVADRYGYLAQMPWLVLLGAGLAAVWDRLDRRAGRIALAAGSVVVLGLCSLGAWRQTRVWRSDRTLWEHVLEGGTSALASTQLAHLAEAEGRLDEALAGLTDAIATAPRYGNAWRAAWDLLVRHPEVARSPRLPALVAALEAGFEAHDDTAIGWRILGLASLRSGATQEALGRLHRAVEIRPDQAINWRWLGLAQLEAGRAVAAADSFQRALDLEPGDATSRNGLAAALTAETPES